MVEEGFRFSTDQRVPLAGFLGDTCVTLFLTDELEARSTSLLLLIYAFPDGVRLKQPDICLSALLCFSVKAVLTIL